MSTFTDSDKDHLFGLLERILKVQVIIAQNTVSGTLLNGKERSDLDEAVEYLNR